MTMLRIGGSYRGENEYASQPFFNSCFFRNALLFCGGIHFDKRNDASFESYYRRGGWRPPNRALMTISTLKTHLGRIAYSNKDYGDAISSFEKTIQAQKLSRE